MSIGAHWRVAARPASFAAPVMAVILTTGGGEPGLSQPIQPPRITASVVVPREVAASVAVGPAMVRIALPPFAEQPERQPGATTHLAVLQQSTIASPAVDEGDDTLSAADLLAAGTKGDTGLSQVGVTGSPLVADTGDAPRSSFEKLFGRPSYERLAPLPKQEDSEGAAPGRIRGPAELVAPIEPAQDLADSRADPVDPGIGRYRQTTEGLAFEVPAKINGAPAGPVSLLIRDGDNISVRLTDLLKAVQPQIDPALYEALSHSDAAQGYMTFNELRAAGIAVRFDRHDQLVLGAAPRG